MCERVDGWTKADALHQPGYTETDAFHSVRLLSVAVVIADAMQRAMYVRVPGTCIRVDGQDPIDSADTEVGSTHERENGPALGYLGQDVGELALDTADRRHLV